MFSYSLSIIGGMARSSFGETASDRTRKHFHGPIAETNIRSGYHRYFRQHSLNALERSMFYPMRAVPLSECQSIFELIHDSPKQF